MNAVFQAMPRAHRAAAFGSKAGLRIGAGIGTLALVAIAQPASAQCVPAAGGVITCDAAGNTYPAGIDYSGVTENTTIVLNGDTVVNATNTGVILTAGGGESLTVNAAPTSSITSANGFGVFLDATTGSISSNTGVINSAGIPGAGVFARTTTGDIVLTGTNTTSNGILSNGFIATTTSGDITVNTGIVSATGLASRGVAAESTAGGNILVNVGAITSQGELADGVEAITNGAGTVTVQGGTITTTGEGAGAFGIQAVTVDGDVSVSNTAVTTLGDATAGISAVSTTGNVQIANAIVSTSGVGSTGIVATTGGAGTVTVTGGTVSTTDGAVAINASSADGNLIVAPTSVTTAGDGGIGILAISSGGTTSVGTTATTITTGGAGSFGVIALGDAGTTVNYGAITTTGDSALGILVPGSGANATVNGSATGTLLTTGAGAHGIVVSADEAVAVNVGRVSTTGTGAQGILATAGTSGTVTAVGGVAANGDAVTLNAFTSGAVTLGGATTSATGTGVVINAGTTAGLTVNAGGSLTGAVNGATITAADAVTVTNFGTIGGANAAIVNAGLGAATINNNAAGVINGRVLLDAGDDVVNNAGTFNAAGDSAFGAGTNVFNNSGTLNVLPGTALAGAVAFTDLTTFNNTGGLIDLRNGHAGDVLALSGNYVGSGNAALAVDANFGAALPSDVLTIAGSATGSTAVTVNRLNTPAVLSTAAGTTFVDAGTASSATAFVIAPGSQNDGVIQYGVVYDAATNNFALVSAPSAAAYRTSLFGDGVRNLWLQSADAWTAHMRELRDNVAANGPGGAGGRFWFQGFGNWEKRASGRTVTFNGITSQVDLGYDQDYYGFQLGMDIGAPVGDEGGFNFGVTGGYQSSNMSFSGGAADQIRFNAVNGGLYASFKSGIFFVNALGKYDYYWGETRSPAGLYGFDINGGVWGAKAEAGLRFGDQFWVEPAVSVSWTNSDFDDFVVPSGTFAIDDEDGLRGKAGARVGYTTEMGAAKVSLYGGANYVREFRGRSNVVFTSGGQSVAFASPRNADYVEGTLGVNVGSQAGKISGFFEGRYADGRDYDGYGVRGGVRVRF